MGLPFAQDAVAKAQTAQVLYTTDANNSKSLNVYYTMPFAGEIVGAARTWTLQGRPGLTINPNKSGSAITTPALVMTTAAYGTDLPTWQERLRQECANRLQDHHERRLDAETMDLQVMVWVLLKLEASEEGLLLSWAGNALWR